MTTVEIYKTGNLSLIECKEVFLVSLHGTRRIKSSKKRKVKLKVWLLNELIQYKYIALGMEMYVLTGNFGHTQTQMGNTS